MPATTIEFDQVEDVEFASQSELNSLNDITLKNTPNQYPSLIEKTVLEADDLILIEDSSNSFIKKKIKGSSFATVSTSSVQSIDGGFANSRYLGSQNIDGGFAPSIFSSSNLIFGGNA